MKKKNLIIGTLCLFSLFGCGNGGSSEQVPVVDNYKDVLQDQMDGGIILHAFCWKFKDIEKYLPAIANAGYKMVQTSPVQQPKSGGGKWEFYYQPVSFSIAESSPLGTKEELKSLCAEAEKYGVKIISDIVFNHLATNGQADAAGLPVVDPEVQTYEPYIYENQATTFHHVSSASAQGSAALTQVYPGLPDLNTANSHVQERALSLLKECIDCGVSGFRFDAAKHIETAKDPQNPSSFWDNTLNKAKEYYEQKTGDKLFAYGEILNDVEGGRDISLYTPYMEVTDNTYCSAVISGMNGKNSQKIVDASYGKKTDVSNLVTWVESHDTYAPASTHFNDKRVARFWAVAAARKDTECLFFARPDESLTVGKIGNYSFLNEPVACVNRFHNRFINADEKLIAQDAFMAIERFEEKQRGAVAISLGGKGEVDFTFENLVDGTYYDQITGQEVVVNNKKAHLVFDEAGIVVLTQTQNVARPRITMSKMDGMFTKSISVTINVEHAEEAYYQVNDGEKVAIQDKIDVTLGEDTKEGETLNLKVFARNGDFTLTKEADYQKIKLVDGYFNVLNLNPSYLTDNEVYIWMWGTQKSGVWSKNYKVEDGRLLIEFEEGYTAFLLALFPKDYEVANVNAWDNKVIKQTADINISTGYFDASIF